MVFLFGYDEGVDTAKPIMFHECSEDELRGMASPTEDGATQLDGIIGSPDSGMYCFDWKQDGEKLQTWGTWTSFTFQYISVLLVPCNFLFPGHEDAFPIPEECIADEKQ